jgi:hypothetical protein
MVFRFVAGKTTSNRHAGRRTSGIDFMKNNHRQNRQFCYAWPVLKKLKSPDARQVP